MFSQWNRIKKQRRNETGIDNVQSNLGNLISQLDQSTFKLAGYATGGDSYCWVSRTMPGDFLPHVFHFTTVGDFPIRDAQIRVVNINQVAEAPSLEAWNRNLFSFSYVRPSDLKVLTLGYDENEDFIGPNGNILRIYAESLNGNTEQIIRLLKVNNEILSASVLTMGNDILREEYSPKFPRDAKGNIDWSPMKDPTAGKTRAS